MPRHHLIKLTSFWRAILKTEFLGKTLSGPFTIPSGIVTTATSIIQAMFDQMPQIGVITTKSVGPTSRAGNREPVYSQYAPGCFVNAVGLTNPGAESAAESMSKLTIPEDRFLLVSIFGGSVQEFVEVAKLWHRLPMAWSLIFHALTLRGTVWLWGRIQIWLER